MIRYSLLIVLFCPAGVFAQANAKIPDANPEVERKSFIVADGFEVNLFASDPLLAKPLEINFDPQGRLWVSSSEVYPQVKPGEKANDKIIILEDTKGVGKADKVTVFAEGLLIPTGVEPGDGGVYVANSTEVLFLSASKPGGKADQQRVVLSGFGTEDTHHILHTLRWGPDGNLYMNQSIYIHSHIETPHGVRRLNAGGIWRFRPETMELDVFVRGFINPWGHQFDYWGQSFVTDGANGEGITHGVPGAYYPTAVGEGRVLHGLNPGSPKHCALEILSGRHLPEDWRGNLLTNDFRGHRVCRFVLKEDGSTYASQEKTELIKTNHAAFRPIDIKMGPDGAIYIADWYNPIIQHGEIDFRDPRRDHTHGRIWRVTAKNRELVKRPELVKASPQELLEFLKAPEDWTRLNAKRVLKERGALAVQPALEAWLQKLDANDPQYEHNLLEGLWTYQSLNVVEPGLLNTLLRAKDYRVRAAATRVLSQWHQRISNAQELLAARVIDEHPRVRMEAIRALSGLQTARAAEIAMTALDKPVDKVLDYCLYLTAKELEPKWMPAFREGKLDFGGNAAHLSFALQSVGSSSAVQPLMNLLKSGKVARDKQDAIYALVAKLGGPAELGEVLSRTLSNELSLTQRLTLLGVLEETAQHRQVKPSGELSVLKALFADASPQVRALGLKLAGLWKVEALRPDLQFFAGGGSTTTVVRRSAFEGLVALGGPKSQEFCEKETSAELPAEIRRMAVIALTGLNLDLATAKAVEFLEGSKPSAELSEVYSAFLQRKGGSKLLAKALTQKKLPAEVAKLGIRAIRSSVQDAPELILALTHSGGLGEAKRDLTPKELQETVADVQKQGDPVRGEAIYRRKDMSCLKCHAIGGAGGQVGPDLASIGASAPVDYLIESILLPNKAVKEGFHAVKVTLLNGKVHSGIKKRESKTEVVLRDAEDKEIVIPVKDIDESVNTRSLMPDGLADTLTRGELVDLVRFLSELGKVGPYSLGKARVIRRWEAFEPTEAGMAHIRKNRVASAADNEPSLTWSSAYTTVAGVLPLEAAPQMRIWNDTAPLSVLRCQLEVTAPGKVKLKVNSVEGLSLWIGASPADVKEEMIVDLPAGVQSIMLSVDRSKRKEGVRLELEDIADSPARVSVIGGK
jgi:putative heme-binding domain-containing protein